MEKSESIKELAIALVKFQAEMEPVVFDASNPFFKSKYATLAKLVSMAAPVHTKYGLAVSQLPEDEGAVTTILMHESGEWISSKLTLKALKKWIKKDQNGEYPGYFQEHPDAQSFGAVITYSRRFAYASILGLISEEDDDGNKASHLKNKEGQQEEIIPIQSKSLREILEMLGKTKFGDLDKFQAWRVDNDLPESLDKLTDFQLAKIMTKVRENKK